jgi:ATP-binding cassette subfamily F protein 2
MDLIVVPYRFNFEDVRQLPPPIIAFDEVAFSYSGKKQDYLYEKLSFGIEYVEASSPADRPS